MLAALAGIFEFSFLSLRFLTPSVWMIYSICKIYWRDCAFVDLLATLNRRQVNMCQLQPKWCRGRTRKAPGNEECKELGSAWRNKFLPRNLNYAGLLHRSWCSVRRHTASLCLFFFYFRNHSRYMQKSLNVLANFSVTMKLTDV